MISYEFVSFQLESTVCSKCRASGIGNTKASRVEAQEALKELPTFLILYAASPCAPSAALAFQPLPRRVPGPFSSALLSRGCSRACAERGPCRRANEARDRSVARRRRANVSRAHHSASRGSGRPSSASDRTCRSARCSARRGGSPRAQRRRNSTGRFLAPPRERRIFTDMFPFSCSNQTCLE